MFHRCYSFFLTRWQFPCGQQYLLNIAFLVSIYPATAICWILGKNQLHVKQLNHHHIMSILKVIHTLLLPAGKLDVLLLGSEAPRLNKSLTPSLAILFSDNILLNWSFYFLRLAKLIPLAGPLHILFLLSVCSYCWNHLHEISSQKSPPPHFSQNFISTIIHINSCHCLVYVWTAHYMESPSHTVLWEV